MQSTQTLERCHAFMAGATIENTFPPRDTGQTYAVVAALNLLNAIVKEPWGPEVVTYNYVKGMAACTFLWLLKNPVDDVYIYWDSRKQVTYFQISGTQFSFHYVPMLEKYRQRLKELPVQEWDGLRLQPLALELFLPVYKECGLEGTDRLRRRMLDFSNLSIRHILQQTVGLSQPYVYQRKHRRQRIDWHKERWYSWMAMCQYDGRGRRYFNLKIALKFHLWTTTLCDLYRPNDNWHVLLARYDGTNYKWVKRCLRKSLRGTRPRPQDTLTAGRLYYCQRTDRQFVSLTPSRHLLLLAQYNFLKRDRKLYSLCITYGVACHLAALYPELRFINVLNYARLSVHHHVYSLKALQRVPPGSKARKMKVWIVVDAEQRLKYYNVKLLPQKLLREYLETENYTLQYQVIRHRGKAGLYAYCRFHLLPPIYANIDIHGNYAHVMRDDHKIAIYSLAREIFVSDFIYDSIWYDASRKAIMARTNGSVVVIHLFE